VAIKFTDAYAAFPRDSVQKKIIEIGSFLINVFKN